MQIRPITLDEIQHYAQLQQEAFVFEPANPAEWIEMNVKPNLENIHGLFDDHNELVTVMGIVYPELWLGQKSLPVAAIYGVVTPPENRRGGHLRYLLTETLKVQREKGYSLAALYPFYFPFYKKFGFEHVSTSKWVTVDLAQLQKFRPRDGGQWKRVSPDQWEVLNTIYQKFCQGQFGQLTRDESWWQRRILRRAGKVNPLFVWYDQSGEPQAYVIYRFEDKDGERGFYVQRAWTNPAAYHEVLAFIANHDSQAKKVKWYTALDDHIAPLLSDPREVEEKSEMGYMLRILDVPKALEARAWPRSANGSFFLKVTDDVFDWNNLILRLDYSEGQLKATPVEAEAAGNNLISCDVRQLAQLYGGFLSPKFMVQSSMLEAGSPEVVGLAQELFAPTGQPVSHMADFF